MISTLAYSQKDPDLNMKIIAHIEDPSGGSGVWHYITNRLGDLFVRKSSNANRKI